MRVIIIPFHETNPYQSLLAKALKELGVEVIVPKRMHKFFSLISALICNRKVDIVHIHWTNPFFISRFKSTTFIKAVLFIVDLFIVKLLGVKVIWTVHNKYTHEEIYKDIDLFVSRSLARIANLLEVKSQGIKQEVEELFGIKDRKKVVVIPHGNYIHFYPNEVSRDEARSILKINSEQKVFLYFGGVRLYKGILELIDVFKKLQTEYPNIQLWIVGKPIDLEIEQKIHSLTLTTSAIKTELRFIPSERVQAYMNAADGVVLPFRDLLTSGSLVLAMSFAKAIIAPYSSYTRDTLNENNFLYDPLDKDGLYKQLKASLSTDLNKIGSLNFERAKSYNWERVGRETLDLYRELVSKG